MESIIYKYGEEMKRLIVFPMPMVLVTLFTNIAQAGFVNSADNPGAATFTCGFSNNQKQHSNSDLINLQFDIDILTTGLFDFTLKQSPVSEPESIVQFNRGGLGLLRLC